MMQDPDTVRLFNIFQPELSRRLSNVKDSGTRFVHYTTADVAMQILDKKKVWMRNATCMNDQLEIAYGRELHVEAWNSPEGTHLKQILEAKFPGVVNELVGHFNNWRNILQTDTYLTCLSEHCPDGQLEEDDLGRLSMWRAYCGTAGVAIVVNNDPMVTISDELGAHTWPVNYTLKDAFFQKSEAFVYELEKNIDFLHYKGREAVVAEMFHKFIGEFYCAKHAGFKEEREWRVVYNPKFAASKYIKEEIKSVRGTPQKVQMLPLEDVPEGLESMKIPHLINKIIIGPTQHPAIIRDALIPLLEAAGVIDPHSKVVMSEIPLRHTF